MIYSLKNLLAEFKSPDLLEFIREQLTELLEIDNLNIGKINEIAHTTHCFVDIHTNMNINGIIVISCKSFLNDKKIFFVERIKSVEGDGFIEQKLMVEVLNSIGPVSKDDSVISLINDSRVQEEVLKPFGFFETTNILFKT